MMRFAWFIVLYTILGCLQGAVFGLSLQSQDMNQVSEFQSLYLKQQRAANEQIQKSFFQPLRFKSQPFKEEVKKTRALKPGPKFIVLDIHMMGADHLDPELKQSLKRQYELTVMNGAQIQQLVDTISQWYKTQGYSLTRAVLPPQNIAEGQLIIQVHEVMVSHVHERVNGQFVTDLFFDYWQPIQAGDLLNIRSIERVLDMLNQMPGVLATVLLKPGHNNYETRLVFDIRESRAPLVMSYHNASQKRHSFLPKSIGFSFSNSMGLSESMHLFFSSSNIGLGQNSHAFTINFRQPIAKTFIDLGVSLNNYTQFYPLDSMSIHVSGQSQLIKARVQTELGRNQFQRLSASLGVDVYDTQHKLMDTPLDASRYKARNTKMELQVLSRFPSWIWDLVLSVNLGKETTGQAPLDVSDAEFSFFH